MHNVEKKNNNNGKFSENVSQTPTDVSCVENTIKIEEKSIYRKIMFSIDIFLNGFQAKIAKKVSKHPIEIVRINVTNLVA